MPPWRVVLAIEVLQPPPASLSAAVSILVVQHLESAAETVAIVTDLVSYSLIWLLGVPLCRTMMVAEVSGTSQPQAGLLLLQ